MENDATEFAEHIEKMFIYKIANITLYFLFDHRKNFNILSVELKYNDNRNLLLVLHL